MAVIISRKFVVFVLQNNALEKEESFLRIFAISPRFGRFAWRIFLLLTNRSCACCVTFLWLHFVVPMKLLFKIPFPVSRWLTLGGFAWWFSSRSFQELLLKFLVLLLLRLLFPYFTFLSLIYDFRLPFFDVKFPVWKLTSVKGGPKKLLKKLKPLLWVNHFRVDIYPSCFCNLFSLRI